MNLVRYKTNHQALHLLNESVTGYIIILAKDIADAVHIAKKCPILQGEGTSVVIRETFTPWTMKSRLIG